MRVTSRTIRLLTATGASALVAILFMGAQPAAQAGVINACSDQKGTLRVVGVADACKPQETPISWSILGPTGPAGPAGPTGPQGLAGLDGRDGRDGRDAEAPGVPPPTIIGQVRITTLPGIPAGAATPIFNFATGATNTGSASSGGGGAGVVDFTDFVVTKMLDGFSAPFLQAAATGRHIMSVQIEIFEPGTSTVFATYGLTDALITSDVFGSTVTGITETVAFDFAKLDTTIILGGMTFHSCYDVGNNIAC